MINLEQQIACIRRELALRERVYPRFVANNRMSKSGADYELTAMRAVLKTLLDAAGDRGQISMVV